VRLFRRLQADREQRGSTDDPPDGCCAGLSSAIPRVEILLLLAGLGCTILGKMAVVRSYAPADFVTETAIVAFPDILFFAIVALLIRLMYVLKPSAFCARCAILIAAIVVVWSVLNTAWLMVSGVQLQPGILTLFLFDFKDIWPLAKAHVLQGIKQIVLLGIGVLAVGAFFLRCLLRPRKIASSRRNNALWVVALVVIISGALPLSILTRAGAGSSFAGEVLDFSSHWHALTSTVANWHRRPYPLTHSPNIYLAGQREIDTPNIPSGNLPNVVLVLLEGVSHSVTSLSGRPTTPHLARLAGEGVEFRTTRVPAPYTSKAYWATLTATTPVIDMDEIEAIPAERPYESLATILSGAGYRTAFFEMSKGNFECAPGFFSNLGFDWAWFRENLEDPSAYLGYLGGDDCRMIKPACEWIEEDGEPFLMMMITSVAHDPFDIPDWFEKPEEKAYDKYLQTVRFTDHFLERLCRELQNLGVYENTLICVLGDHGTSFRTEQAKGRWIPYEEVIRIPWVMSWSGHIRAGQVVEQPCSQMDVTPTILSRIGFGIANAGFEGRDALTDVDQERKLYFSSLLPNSPLGYVQHDRKVVYWPYIDKAFEYDLTADPREEHPVTIAAERMEEIEQDIRRWEGMSQIAVDPKKHTQRFVFSHWQIFSAGRSAWAYYVP